MSFIHPKKYKNIKDVFSYLKSKRYIKELDGNHKIKKTITSVNELFKKYEFKVVIKKEDVTNEDLDFIKIRRKDEITTTIYDIYKINEILKKKKKVQKFIGVFIYENDNILDNYLCLVNEKEYKKFFEN